MNKRIFSEIGHATMAYLLSVGAGVILAELGLLLSFGPSFDGMIKTATAVPAVVLSASFLGRFARMEEFKDG